MAPFKSTLARSVGKLLGVHRERDLSLRGFVQSVKTIIPFSASGGSVSTPGDGYKYHDFTSSGSFIVSGEATTLEVLLQGGGGGGQSPGAGGGNSPGGGGGGGGATGVWTVSSGAGTNPVTVGGGGGVSGAGGNSRLTNVSGSYMQSAGGSAPNGSASTNTDPWTGASITGNFPGAGGDGPSGYSGRPGGSAGGVPQPAGLWWRPYISPGVGGSGGGHGNPGGSTPGSTYGGGGAGGAGGFDGGGAGTGRSGGAGRVVIRYEL